MEENFRTRLSKLQEELKAPKNMHNDYGNYFYRNAEGILESVKPLLTKYGLLLNITDDVVVIGDRYYIKAIATVSDTETEEHISVSAFARESLDKKGMDPSQISGSASSYARKYALNGLFLLDDAKDSDNYGENGNDEEQKFNEQAQKDLAGKASEAQKNTIINLCNKHKVSLNALLKSNSLELDTLTAGDATNIIVSLKKKFGDE